MSLWCQNPTARFSADVQILLRLMSLGPFFVPRNDENLQTFDQVGLLLVGKAKLLTTLKQDMWSSAYFVIFRNISKYFVKSYLKVFVSTSSWSALPVSSADPQFGFQPSSSRPITRSHAMFHCQKEDLGERWIGEVSMVKFSAKKDNQALQIRTCQPCFCNQRRFQATKGMVYRYYTMLGQP